MLVNAVRTEWGNGFSSHNRRSSALFWRGPSARSCTALISKALNRASVNGSCPLLPRSEGAGKLTFEHESSNCATIRFFSQSTFVPARFGGRAWLSRVGASARLECASSRDSFRFAARAERTAPQAAREIGHLPLSAWRAEPNGFVRSQTRTEQA